MNWASFAAVAVLLALPVLAIRATISAGLIRRAGDGLVPGVEDTGLVGWHKPPAPGKAAGIPPAQQATPAPGHHRGSHMVIDTWQCGCIYTWTRAAGWVHDYDCLDEAIRKLLTS